MESRLRFISPIEAALHLRGVDVLGDLPPTDLALVAHNAREHHFAKDDVLCVPGDPAENFHVIVEGEVHTRGGEHGDAVLGPGDAVGLLTLLSRVPGQLEARAVSETRTLEVDGDRLLDVLEDHSYVLEKQMRGLAGRLLDERASMPDGTYLAPAEGVTEPPEDEADLIDRLILMKRSLSRDNVDGLFQMAQRAREVHFDAGVTLWQRGEPAGYSLMIVRGTVHCGLEEKGRYFRCGPGYPLGNLESVAAQSRWYTATTETPLVVLQTETEFMVDLVEDHFEMGLGYVAGLASSIIQLREQSRSRQKQENSPADAVDQTDGGDPGAASA